MGKNKKTLLKEQKKKVPFAVLRKGALVGLLGFSIGLGGLALVGCMEGTDGKAGVDGSKWYSGTTNIEQVTEGVNGDFYYDTDDYKLYQKENGSWVLKVENFGKPGTNGASVYVGYDGYVWQDGKRTNFKLDQDTTGRENVVEDTIGAYTTMGYWAGEYIDLSTNSIALMANYKSNSKLTQYSGSKVTEIQVVAENAGTLRIGTAKVANVVNARTTGTTYTATTTSYNVDAGLNTISLDLTVAEDETVVLGGADSTAKIYVVKNLPVDDEQGNYTLVDASAHNDIISKTGNYADTLAVSVRCDVSDEETAVFENITTDYPATASSIMEVNLEGGAPYRYYDNTKFQGKTITKIGAIVVENNAGSGEKPFMTVYKHKVSDTSNYNTGTAIKIYFPEDTQAKTWAYADCDIKLADDETIAFGASSGDTIVWGYSSESKQSDYNFVNSNNGNNRLNFQLLFDVYVEGATGWGTHLETLEASEQQAIQAVKDQSLKAVLQNKNFSILGDSISTFNGYSNDNTNTNSTIGGNAVYYSGSNNGVTDVNETWWKQIANRAGMNVLVNNSYSGDKVTGAGQTRCEQLHDDTGDNAGTNPDIIAVYLGINDFDGGVSADTFKTSYDTMIGKIVAKYNSTENSTSADIYLFTLLPNNIKNDTTTLLAYNSAIREIAKKYGCTVVDLYADSGVTVSNMASYTNASDCLHPNMAGMDKMTDCFWNVLYNKYVTDAD